MKRLAGSKPWSKAQNPALPVARNPRKFKPTTFHIIGASLVVFVLVIFSFQIVLFFFLEPAKHKHFIKHHVQLSIKSTQNSAATVTSTLMSLPVNKSNGQGNCSDAASSQLLSDHLSDKMNDEHSITLNSRKDQYNETDSNQDENQDDRIHAQDQDQKQNGDSSVMSRSHRRHRHHRHKKSNVNQETDVEKYQNTDKETNFDMSQFLQPVQRDMEPQTAADGGVEFYSVHQVRQLVSNYKPQEVREYLRRWRSAYPEPPNSASYLMKQNYAERIIVSKKNKFMYCPIPKAANSNWKALIRRFEGFTDYQDLTKAHTRNKNGLHFLDEFTAEEIDSMLNDPSYFKFIFVRNPLSRLLSCYLNKFKQNIKNEKEYRIFLSQLYSAEAIEKYNSTDLPQLEFGEFLDAVAAQNYSMMNEHWSSQSYLCGVGEFPYDFLGHFENIAEESQWVLQAIERSSSFPSQEDIKFAPSNASALIKKYYTTHLAEKVLQIFGSDFQNLDYNSNFSLFRDA